MKAKRIFVRFIVFLILTITNRSFAQTNIGKELTNGDGYYYNLGEEFCLPNQNTLAFSYYERIDSSNFKNIISVFNWKEDKWVMKGEGISELNKYDFGDAISMPDQNTIAIIGDNSKCSESNSNSNGFIVVYHWINNSWKPKGDLILLSCDEYDSFNPIFMADSNTLAVGMSSVKNSTGGVAIYEFVNETWIKKSNTIYGINEGDEFGSTINMPNNSTIAISAPYFHGAEKNSGSVVIYNWTGKSWVKKGNDIIGLFRNGQIGSALDMPDDKTIAIGASNSSSINGIRSGKTIIYYWDGVEWLEKGEEILGKFSSCNCGSSVSMPNKDIIAIGCPEGTPGFKSCSWSSRTGYGYVEIYRFDGCCWKKTKDEIKGNSIGDCTGYFLSMPDSITLAIGSPNKKIKGYNEGAIEFYNLLNDQEISESNNIYIGPNPTFNNINIIFKDIQKHLNFRLYSIDGRILENSILEDTIEFNYVINFPAGIYILVLSSETTSSSFKIVKI